MSTTADLPLLIYDRTTAPLPAAERQYRELLTNLRDVVVELGPAGVMTFLNPAWTEQLGHPVEGSVGRRLAEFTDELPDALLGTSESPPNARGELALRNSAGGLVWFEFSAQDIANGRKIVWLHNIDARRRAEEKLQEGQARFQAIVESALDCIMTVDRQGRVIEFNPAAERTFGYTREEILGKALGGLILSNDHLAGIDHYLSTGESQQLRQRLTGLPALRKDGTKFLAEMTVAPMEQNGEPVFTAFLRDITERFRHESDLKQAKEDAEAASRAKSQFLANMSHEVRTPMGVVMGYTDMLLDPRLPDQERTRIVKAIRRNGDHLLRLINDILDLSKIEAREVQLEHVPFGLWHLIDEVLSAVQVKAEEKKIDLKFEAIGRLPRVLTTDPTRLRQVLLNLLDNAVKFTSPGRWVELRLRLDLAPSTGARLVFEVEDQGRGMTPEEQARLFKPFVQADASTTRMYGGTGLGLSICKRLAAAFGGDIRLCSELGKGSCFTVAIPVDKGDLKDLVEDREFTFCASNVRAMPPGFSRPSRKLAGRVLLVDDNADNRNILSYFLEKVGLTVEQAENGQEAVDKATTSEFDVILMDMQMPVLDGYSATIALRARNYKRSILALTAHGMVGDQERCIQAGCDAHLTKPIEPDYLIETVARYLRPRSWVVKADSLIRRANPAAPSVARAPQPPLAPPSSAPGLPELLTTFRRSLPEKLHELTTALSAGNHTRVAALAHKLKGSAGMYGLPEISETACLLESACEEGQGRGLLGELLDELADLMIQAAKPSHPA